MSDLSAKVLYDDFDVKEYDNAACGHQVGLSFRRFCFESEKSILRWLRYSGNERNVSMEDLLTVLDRRCRFAETLKKIGRIKNRIYFSKFPMFDAR